MFATLGDDAWSGPATLPAAKRTAGRLIYESAPGCDAALQAGTLPPWSVVVRIAQERSTGGAT